MPRAKPSPGDEPETLDESMTPSDLIWTLEHLLPLTRRQSATISIDRGICDYLIAAVKARHGK